MTLSDAVRLYDEILHTLKRKAQTQQFGEFLSDLDMECITNDYHHILKVHVSDGDKTWIENCFRFFELVHHYDKPTDECRSVKRNENRRHRVNSHSNEDATDIALNEEANKDIWRLKQHYIQSQLDIIHSYLVHSKWQRVVQKYSKEAVDGDD
eukprot:1066588_1